MQAQDVSLYFSEIAKQLHEAILIVGTDGKIIFANRSMESLIGFSAREIEGSPCTVLGCDACHILRSETQDAWCALFIKGRVRDKRCMLTRKDGTFVSTMKNASLIRNAKGRPVAAIETFGDLTESDKKDAKILELTRALQGQGAFCGIVGESRAMKDVFQLIEKAARSDANILIAGESGTGKELVASALHETGKRKSRPFIKINCSALSESLIESELFGHAKGAFTGAYQHRKGLFEMADGGDVFLDEISEIATGTQAKLLRIVENKQLERVGDHKPLYVDVRVIAATNRNLDLQVAEGRFRPDLYYRLNVFPIHLPPLNERREDIPLLAYSLVQEFRKKFSHDHLQISPAVMDLLTQYHWPGNVRELRSVLEYASILSDSGMIELRDLPNRHQELLLKMNEKEVDSGPAGDAECEEKIRLVNALEQSGGNQSRAAALLGVHRMTVWNRMRKYGIASKRVLG
jgi:PAS domain S-box-containing protein